jgi:hypothetical protein
MTFRVWLLRQQGRRDPVGDLARDTAADVKDGGLCGRWGARRLAVRMRELGACEGATLALKRALREYRGQS